MSLLTAIDCFDQAINAGQFSGYLSKPLPDELDAIVEAFILAFIEADASEQELAAALPAVAPRVLLAFCERKAILAVRELSPAALRHSLLAAGVASAMADDFRDVALNLVLPWRSAHHLGVDAHQEFLSAARVLPASAAESLTAFTRRAPDDQSLKCMGYSEVGEGAAFRYVREW